MRRLSLIIVVALVLTGCAKYDDGPMLSLYSKGKRVEGNWYFSKVLYNEVDSTEHYVNGSIKFFLGEGSGKDWGIFQWNRGLGTYHPDNLRAGGWKFIADKDSFQMVILADRFEDSDTVNWKINRLAYDEWWMERQLNDTTTLRWQMWKWVGYY